MDDVPDVEAEEDVLRNLDVEIKDGEMDVAEGYCILGVGSWRRWTGRCSNRGGALREKNNQPMVGVAREMRHVTLQECVSSVARA